MRGKFLMTTAAMVTASTLLCACNSDAKIEAKRDQDRVAMQLMQAQKQHDQDTQDLTKLRSDLQTSTTETQRAKADLDDANTRLKKANDDQAATSAENIKLHQRITALQGHADPAMPTSAKSAE